MLVWLLALLTGAGTAFAATSLMTPVTGTKALRSNFDIKSQATPVTMSRATLGSLKRGAELDLSLPNGTRHLVVFDRIEDHGGAIRSSVGYLKAHGKDFRVIITTGPGGAFGSIRTPETVYRIVPGLEGHDLLVDMTEEHKHIPHIDLGNDARRVPDHLNPAAKNAEAAASQARFGKQAGEPGIALATPTPQNTIDLMIVYTNGLGARLGPGLMTRLYNLVTAANTAYSDSEVAITLRLVNATMVNYTDANGDDVALDDITPGVGLAGVFANIENIRTANGADMVALLRTGADFGGGGIAWITTSATPLAGFMYSVTTGCVVGCDSVFIHELGHNMGNGHDRATAAYQDSMSIPRPGAFPYSFGHFFCASGQLTCNPNLPPSSGGCNMQPQCSTFSTNNVGTIMSYFNPVTLKFSNPNLQCAPGGGGGLLQPCGVVGQEDNARSMNDMRVALQSLKTQTIVTPPGALQFTATSYSTTEATGMVTVTVQRVGGSAGMITVNYATQNGTAIAGADYTATSGTLVWANGDTTNKTINVPITNDGIVEGQETFNVVLSSPGGAVGAFIGAPATAAVNILPPEIFPPDCLIPAGWTTPMTTPYGWAVAFDRARNGSCSLKSDAMPDAAQPGAANANKAQISTTGNYQAGTVSFYYNVLSEASFDCLRFLIDGSQRVEMGGCFGIGGSGASGNISTWTPISIAVPAGTHTFTWSYEKDDQIAPVGDAAWIDDVVLPSLVPASTLQFTTSAMSVFEGIGSAVVNVSRSGGSTGAVAVTYATSSGTATTGADFTGQAGTLNWADGDAANKSINIPISDDALVEGNEIFTVTLSSPIGATLGTPTSIAVTILDNDFATAPGAPTIGTATPGNTVATISFTAPASDGGSPITGYTVTCDGGSTPKTGTFSPITVTVLSNGTLYNCSVTASNAIGPGPPSATVAVTPSAGAALALVAVQSRKVHAGVGPFDLMINPGVPITGAVSVEPRNVGAAHTIVFRFNNTVTAPGTVTAVDASMASIGNPTVAMSTNEVIVTLTGVPDNKRLTVALANVNGSFGTTASIGFLVGDVNGTRSVNATDISGVKAQVGQPISATNFRFDLNATGGVSAVDVSVVKSRAGVVLP